MIAVIGDSSRQAASIGLHQPLGFRHVGILEDVGFKHGRWLDSVLMQRLLGPGSTKAPQGSCPSAGSPIAMIAVPIAARAEGDDEAEQQQPERGAGRAIGED